MIDDKFVTAVRDLAQLALKPHVMDHPELPDDLHIVHNGSMTRVAKPPPRRDHHLATVADLVALLLDKDASPSPEVFVSSGSATAILNRASRRAMARVDFERSSQFDALDSMSDGGRKMKVKELYRFLRYDLHDSGPQTEAMLTSVRKLDFEVVKRTVMGAAHGEDTLGKTVAARVEQAVRDEFIADVQIFPRELDDRFPIRIGVEIDVEGEAISLRPYHNDVSSALWSAVDVLAKQIAAGAKCPVFRGMP